MNGKLWLDMLFWFFALSGFFILLTDLMHYFMFKDTFPDKMAICIPAGALGEDKRAGVANLLNLLYEQNPKGNYEIIILDDTQNASVATELSCIADASECIFVTTPAYAAQYIRQDFR